MRLTEAKQIAANPSAYPDRLCLAHLKLGNAILRALASSPNQKDLRALQERIEAMPRALWHYDAP